VARHHRCGSGRLRSALAAALALALTVATGTAAYAHGGEANVSASELVLTALAILEVHPAPAAAVEDKIADAQDAKDQSGVDLAVVKQAGEALDRGDVAQTKALLERSVGECPDADILYVNDQPEKPPCIVSAHELSQPRRAVGGTSEVVILIVAAALALVGILIITHPYVRRRRSAT
jgi:hypothetical protein